MPRAADAVAISAYIDEGTEFDEAIAEFAMAYADQTEGYRHGVRDGIDDGIRKSDHQSKGD